MSPSLSVPIQARDQRTRDLHHFLWEHTADSFLPSRSGHGLLLNKGSGQRWRLSALHVTYPTGLGKMRKHLLIAYLGTPHPTQCTVPLSLMWLLMGIWRNALESSKNACCFF